MRKRVATVFMRGETWIFANPATVLILILGFTALFAIHVPKLAIHTNFDDLLPQKHPYIETYNRVKETFGGVNQIVVAIEVERGDIFNRTTLDLIDRATREIDSLPSINHNFVSSLTHRTVRRVFVKPDGGFGSTPYYDSRTPPMTSEALDHLRSDVMSDPQVFGLLVSPNLKAALIRGQLNEGNIDYSKTFAALQRLRQHASIEGHHIYLVGNPVLVGSVYTYLGEIYGILAWTFVLLAVLLILYFRRLYGVALPLLGITFSSVWGLGFMAWLGFNLEPLSLPIPFLIAARAMSHGVQLVARYYEEFADTHNGARAARNALDALFRPGSLAITVDAVCIAVLVLAAAPFNWKLGISAGFWAFSVIFTVHFMIPLALTILPQPKRFANKNRAIRDVLRGLMAATAGKPVGAAVILIASAVAVVAAAPAALSVKVGESEPGSPILQSDHYFNRSTAAINQLFPGFEELNVIARTNEKGGLKRPEVMQAIDTFDRYMQRDPSLGAVRAIPLVVRQVNRLTHNDDPRWAQLPDNAVEIGGLMFTYLASNPTPGALKEFIDADEEEANLVFLYKDHRAETINRAVGMINEAARLAVRGIKGLEFLPGGGIVGVSAAANQALHHDHALMVPLVMLAAFVLVTVYYQSFHAGLLMVVPMLFSTVLTYAYMGVRHINISVNTVPVIMIGIGVGIDYAVYFMDRIREEMTIVNDVREAAIKAGGTTGYAVSFTACTLIAGVVLWIFMSQLRFQSDAALLLSYMLFTNALAATLIVPAWCVRFRPRFVTGNGIRSGCTRDSVLES